MWCALAFDGYKRVRWQSLNVLQSGPDHRLADVLSRLDADNISGTTPGNMDDAFALAAASSRQKGTLISGWYTLETEIESNSVTNYFIYVLDLDRGLIVELSLLT